MKRRLSASQHASRAYRDPDRPGARSPTRARSPHLPQDPLGVRFRLSPFATPRRALWVPSAAVEQTGSRTNVLAPGWLGRQSPGNSAVRLPHSYRRPRRADLVASVNRGRKTVPGWIVRRGAGLVNVKVDPDENQRPEDRREQRRDDSLERVEVLPVVMRGRDDAAGDEVDDEEQAKAGPRSCCCWCVVSHAVDTSFRRRSGYPLPVFENGGLYGRPSRDVSSRR